MSYNIKISSVGEKFNLRELDNCIIDKAVKGDDEAFHKIVDHYTPELFRLAYSIVKNADDTEDILQETFLGAFRQITRFRRLSSLKTWLIRIMFNQIARLNRSQKTVKMISIEEINEDGEKIAELNKESPEREFEVKTDVRKMLSTLGNEYREIIILRELHRLSYGEIAQVLNIPIGTVESRLFRARQELKLRFKNYFDKT